MKKVKFTKKLELKKESLARMTLSNEELAAVNGREDDLAVKRSGLICGSGGEVCSNTAALTCSFMMC
jgi:hypothetical protein